jgi:hypothetical protein
MNKITACLIQNNIGVSDPNRITLFKHIDSVIKEIVRSDDVSIGQHIYRHELANTLAARIAVDIIMNKETDSRFAKYINLQGHDLYSARIDDEDIITSCLKKNGLYVHTSDSRQRDRNQNGARLKTYSGLAWTQDGYNYAMKLVEYDDSDDDNPNPSATPTNPATAAADLTGNDNQRKRPREGDADSNGRTTKNGRNLATEFDKDSDGDKSDDGTE